MKRIDLHAHTHYSNCGRDLPEDLIKEMINNRIDVLGITDHNYGIGVREKEYRTAIKSLAKKYRDKITILCGIELCTMQENKLNSNSDLSEYDYCLVENLGSVDSVMKDDIVEYTSQFKCIKGIAHTDLFGFIAKNKLNPYEYLSSLRRAGIFWELNVNYDSIHGYREHNYVKTFFSNQEQQDIVKKVGLYVAVGFDGHRKEDYCVSRVEMANEFLEKNNILNAVELFNLNK